MDTVRAWLILGGRSPAGFEPVWDAFAENFESHGDVGASLCVYRGGEVVVDLWGGVADVHTGRPYGADTLQLVFSTTKGMAAICAHLLVQRGTLDLDSPVAHYWPEFAANGKAEVSVRQLLSHVGGLAAIDEPTTVEEFLAFSPVTGRLAAQSPNWEPGSARATTRSRSATSQVSSYVGSTADHSALSSRRRSSSRWASTRTSVCPNVSSPVSRRSSTSRRLRSRASS